MARGERRVDPFNEDNPRSGQARDGGFHGGKPGTQLGHERLGPLRNPGASADGHDRVEYLVQRVWVQRQDVGLAA